ncbi:DsbA family protein [Bacillaceae bacterium]
MAEVPLKEAIQGRDVQVEWMPFELRPKPTPTLRPEGEYLQHAWKTSVYPLAKKLGVEIKLPDISPQPYTDLAFEGFQFAKERGKAGEYNHAVFVAFFQQGRDIGNIDVLAQIAETIGLDRNDFKNSLLEGSYKEKHQEALRHAYEEAKITAVPTFVIGRRRLSGLYPAEVLRRVIDEESAARGRADRAEGISCGIEGC